jgi:cystathionine beta-lyase
MEALHRRVEHGIFGYTMESKELKEVIVNRLADLYAWHITPEDLVFTPGVVAGFNLASQMFQDPSQEILIQTPVYPPFLRAAPCAGLKRVDAPLVLNQDNTYSIDMADFRQRLSPSTAMFILCNPHNPVGRVFTQAELEGMAEACLSNGTIICSDEIHCDFIYSGHRHTPIAAISPEIAVNTITLMAPSKTFNIAGLDFAFAVIQNPELRKRYTNCCKGLTGGTNMMGQVAARAAFQDGKEWLKECLAYLEANRDFLVNYIKADLPDLQIACPESTFLAWIDCRNLGLKEKPAEFFLREGKVALNAGEEFGTGGEGHVRLNFGCPRSLLEDGLARMAKAIKG